MRRKLVIVVVVVGIVVAAAVMVVAPWRQVPPPIPQLDAEQGERDRLPADLDPAAMGADPESMRYLGSSGGARYWAARGAGGSDEVCFLAEIPPEESDVVACQCASEEEMLSRGLSVSVVGGGERRGEFFSAHAYLLPAGSDVQPLLDLLGDDAIEFDAVDEDGAIVVPLESRAVDGLDTVRVRNASGETMTLAPPG